MKAGKLRHRVTIQTRTISQDGYGDAVETWTSGDTVWAEVTPLLTATREAFVAQSETRSARQTLQVRMRWRDGLTPAGTRLLWDGETLDVESVMDPDGRHAELIVLCYARG